MKWIKSDLRDEVMKSLKVLADTAIYVGVPSSEAPRTEEDGEKSELNNAELAYIHDTGSEGMPARPFLKVGVMEGMSKIEPYMAKAAKATLNLKPIDARKQIENVGLAAERAVKDKLMRGPFRPLSVRTILNRAERGHAGAIIEVERMKTEGKAYVPDSDNVRPLIDTKKLFNSITYVVGRRKT